MKKRLLALALCLVTMTSLLPVTVFAEYSRDDMRNWVILEDGKILESNKVYCGDIYITINCPVSGGYNIKSVQYHTDLVTPESDGRYKLEARNIQQTVYINFKNSQGGTDSLSYQITINSGHTWNAWTSNGDGTHSLTCSNGCGTPTTEPPVPCVDANGDHKCDGCKASVHTWQFKAAGNTLTGYCGGANCDIKEVSVSLKADSVTLPNSPFNAKLVGEDSFKAVFTNAVFDDIRYDYEESEGVWDYGIAPIAANAKAGNYQAFVAVSGLPGHVVLEGGEENPNGEGYLYVKYTAADPKVTAQTGDNRPIELMLGSVVVFSALAAAAFVADSKRKYQQ